MTKIADLNRLFVNRLLACAYPCRPYPTDIVAAYPLDAPESWSLGKLVEAGADPFGRFEDGIPFLHFALSICKAELAEAVADCQLRRMMGGDEAARDLWEASHGVDALGRTRLVTLLNGLLNADSGWLEHVPLPEVDQLLSIAMSHESGRGKAIEWARDATSRDQWTPIHLAARLHARLAVPVIQRLLKSGAPKTLRDDREGLTALEWIERQIKEGDTGGFCFSFEEEEGLEAIADALR